MFMESSVEEHLEGESKANMAEALVVKDLVQGLLDRKEVPLTEIGVVTPYKGQVRVLRKLLQSKDALALGAGLADEEIFKLEIASVDNFQGREKEVIIFSAVRCNTWGSVGFLKDWRRLNVMITRARRALVVVGNAATLCKDEHWRKWLECTERQGGAKKARCAGRWRRRSLGWSSPPWTLTWPPSATQARRTGRARRTRRARRTGRSRRTGRARTGRAMRNGSRRAREGPRSGNGRHGAGTIGVGGKRKATGGKTGTKMPGTEILGGRTPG
ncbi:unnamed protein product, partial [Effrenium voratum]